MYILQFCTFTLAVLLQSGFWDIKLQRYWGHDFDLSGHVTSSVMRSLDSQCVVSYWMSIWTYHVSRTVVEILSFKDIWVTTLTFWGHVTSSVTWPLDSQYRVSYRWSIWTDRLSCTVCEILSFKGIGVTTLTFRGHVTSSVTWPLDSQCVVSYS